MRTPYTRADFLEWEARQPDRYELVGGIIKMIAGGSVDHNRIAGNIFAALNAGLRGSPCEAFQHNMRLIPAENDDATYPDVIVTCRPVEGSRSSIETATVIVEVLSPSSREDDFSRKWEGYQAIADLRHYAIVSQDAAAITLYSRRSPEEDWVFRRIEGLGAVLPLPAIAVELDFQTIYERTRVVGGEAAPG